MRRTRVLLLSSRPEKHSGLLNSLESRGIPARAACSPEDASRLLDGRPMTLLIDLVNGPGLDRGVVEKISRRRSGLVLGLHDGELHGTDGPHADLPINGFCFIGDWGAIASTTPADGVTLALH